MYPFERSLVERLKDKPFVLVGVNSDRDREKLKDVIRKENITWRSFWDGPGTSGLIARRWSINSWPRIFIIDQDGNVRYRIEMNQHVHQTIERAVNTLLRDLEQGSTVSKQ